MSNKYTVPKYQSGGLVLPQYRPTGATLQTPQAASMLINTFNQNNQQDFGRYMQLEQLDMQRQQQNAQQNSAMMDQQLRMSQQVRVNKQIDLQNKKYEHEVLKQGIEMQKEALDLGKNEFLPLDQQKVDLSLKDINDEIANTDTRDLENFAKLMTKKRQILMTHKNGYENVAAFKRAAEALKTSPNNKLIKDAMDGKYGDLESINQYRALESDYYKNLNSFYTTGDKTFLDKANEMLPQIQVGGDFINEELQLQQQALDLQNQQTDILVGQSNAAKLQAAANLTAATTPFNIQEAQFKIEQNNRKTQDWNNWEKENQDATTEERTIMRNKIFGDKSQSDKVLSFAEIGAQALLNDDMETYRLAQQAVHDFDTTGNSSNNGYTYNSLGARQDKNGDLDYGSFKVDKSDKVTAMTINGSVINTATFIDDKYKDIVNISVYGTSHGKPRAYINVTVAGTEADKKRAKQFLLDKFGYTGEFENFTKTIFPNNKEIGNSSLIQKGILKIPSDKPTLTPGADSSNSNIDPRFQNNPGARPISSDNPFNK